MRVLLLDRISCLHRFYKRKRETKFPVEPNKEDNSQLLTKDEEDFDHVLCVVDLVEVAAGVVGREDAGLAGAGVAVIVAGVDGVDADTVVVAGVAVGVAGTAACPLGFCCTAAVDTVSTTRMRIQAFGP